MGIKVRILVATTVQGVAYQPNQLVVFPDADAKALVKQVVADSSKPAIAYCENELQVKAIEHKPAAGATAIGGQDGGSEGEIVQ